MNTIPIFISIYDFEGSGKTALVSFEALISKNKEKGVEKGNNHQKRK